ncbi:MAG: hypothetical protein RBR07_02435 [Arcobacteraceae bacterium]|nr:hypothetical protein [Arcobacteraceae bacterium]
MIVVVKRIDYKKLAIKVGSILALIILFGAYYIHMSGVYSEFENKNDNKAQAIDTSIIDKQEQKTKEIENIIYEEALIATNLIGNDNLKDIKILDDRLLIVAIPSTDIEPIMIRYGVLALVQNTKNDIKIAIDLASIVQSRYVEDDETN